MNSWADSLVPARMRRVAVVAPAGALRDTLVRLAAAGCVELDRPDGGEGERRGPAARGLAALGDAAAAAPLLSALPPDPDGWRAARRADLLAGEAQLETYLEAAVRHGGTAALAGWCPAGDLSRLGPLLAEAGGAVVPLRAPSGAEPPTLLYERGTVRRAVVPLVRTYGTVPYADADPSLVAGAAYVVMFGMMFGDAGHGLLLLAGALLLRSGRPARLAALRPVWPFVAGAGVASVLAGVAYGEFFGPTGVLPVLWLDPVDEPLRLLGAAVAFGAVLLAAAYAAGIVNRWREGGPARALYAASGVAGASVFLGLAVLAAGLARHTTALTAGGSLVALAGLALAGTGMFAASGGGGAGVLQTGVQLFDVVVRIGSNTVSFARLAAFGLTHAALGAIVWRGTTALAGAGPAAVVAAAVVLVLGNALTFALEALVAGVQALRLEFYELFSRVFETEGRPFRPWHVPTERPARTGAGTGAPTDGSLGPRSGTEVTT
ncbi:V-type ATPase 116kDa subunit family protein [Streptomyces sp. NPDC047000]|uniref:V-type ATPase 116kDa subunit family protein n=1 Tax=Streptomyces sp. NPDC047000 TaxID=3155474 RepID=UPI0033EA44F9